MLRYPSERNTITPPRGSPASSKTSASERTGLPRPVAGSHRSLSTAKSTVAQPHEHRPTTRTCGSWARSLSTPSKSCVRSRSRIPRSVGLSGRGANPGVGCGCDIHHQSNAAGGSRDRPLTRTLRSTSAGVGTGKSSSSAWSALRFLRSGLRCSSASVERRLPIRPTLSARSRGHAPEPDEVSDGAWVPATAPSRRVRSQDACNAFALERALKGMVNSLILRQNAAG